MINLILIWGIIFSFGISFFKVKKYSPVVVFNFYWIILTIGAYFRFDDKIRTANSVYFIILIGMLAFTVGYSLPNIVIKVKDTDYSQYDLNDRLLKIFIIFNLIILIICASRSLTLLFSGFSSSYIRYSASDIVFGGEIVARTYKFFTVPILFLLFAIYSWEIVSKREKNKFILRVVPLYLALITLIEFSLLNFFVFILSIFFAFITSESLMKISYKQKRKIIILLSLLMIIGIVTFNVRSGNGIIQRIYDYFTCALPFFSAKIEYTNIYDIHTFGMASFQGIIRPVIGVLEIFGFSSPLFDEATEYLLFLQNNAENIIGNSYYNYFSTCFSYMYKDGGYIGVVLISMLWGIFERRVFFAMRKNYNIKTISLYLMGISSILIGCMEFFACEPRTVWGYILLFVIVKKRNQNKRDVMV